MDIKKTVVLGTFAGTSRKIGRYHSSLQLKVEIQYGHDELNPDKKLPRLSICGETFYPSARDCESGGQIRDEVRRLLDGPENTLNRPREQIARLLEVWERWHLNDMRPGCEHQREWDASEKLELVTYELTTDPWSKARNVRDTAAALLARGETVKYAPEELKLINLPHELTRTPGDPEPGPAYKVAKRETKTAGWVYPKEHPRGLLTKPCPVCGYKYGSAWCYEPLPADVIAFLEAF